jgi:uncharacterized protein (TIGR01777 family)
VKIAIAGGSGFVGTPLVQRRIARGDEVFVLTRDASRVETGTPLVWDGRTQGSWSAVVAAADAVINLAGENIGAGRWTRARKRSLVDSRVNATRALIDAMRSRSDRKRVFVSASAVGLYGLHGDEELDESSPRGRGFLADLAAQWEEEAHAAETIARLVVLRFGVILSANGGALAKMALPFRFGAGGRVGSGAQWMSWVALEDALRAIEWALDNDSVRGAFNVTSPQPVRNRELAKALGRAMRRPSIMPAPAFALRLLLGEMADEALLGGQRVMPRRTLSEGFRFQYPGIAETLATEFRH